MKFTVNMKITSLPEQSEFSSNTSPHCFLSIDKKCFVFWTLQDDQLKNAW